MPALNWGTFAGLPGAPETNFELLCRALIRRHYGRFGDFRALANQPGVEFHLKLHASCPLGDPPRWYGWQCRWYDLPGERAIGGTRRRKIKEAIAKTEQVLPDLSDWVLWTRHPLTRRDQGWFYGLGTRMRLHLWTGADVEEYLSGPAELYRRTYFGELVLTPDGLADIHAVRVPPIKSRWQPDVHQIVDSERTLRRTLGEATTWSALPDLAERIQAAIAAVNAGVPTLPPPLAATATALVGAASILEDSLMQSKTALECGDYEVLRQELMGRARPATEWSVLLRQFRAGRYPTSLDSANLLADMHGAHEVLKSLDLALSRRLVALVADAGCGKTQLAAQLTAATDDRPAGVFLQGRDLHAGQNLDDLARRVVVNGTPVQTFEALVAAVDAAGQRAGRRLPIVLDGLNEAEDPRDWKAALASLKVILQPYSYVLVICTLRSAFVPEALPDDVDQLEMPGFEHDTREAVLRYFRHYHIDPADARLPMRLLSHPLTLRMFCEVTNPTRERIVGIEAMPSSLTALFDRYLEQVSERIAQLSPRSWRYFESDVRTALSRIGLVLWKTRARSINIVELRELLNDHGRSWDTSIVRALEDDGLLIRVLGDRPGAGHLEVVYDALGGHLVADALLGEFGGRGFEAWLQDAGTLSALSGHTSERHPLATDIFQGLVGLAPRRMHRRQLWPLLNEPLRTEALHESACLEAPYLDGETVAALATLVQGAPTGRGDLFDRLQMTRAARSHPLDAEFLDSLLRSMSMPERDLRWTEWVRRNRAGVLDDLQRLDEQWRTIQHGDVSNKLRARWAMWTLTSSVRLLRDQATRALYRFGCSDPSALFDLALESLAVNDPYVPERMLAACYGVAMSLWADPRGEAMRGALPEFASALVDRMFVPDSPHPTRHVLMRDSALGVITLARRVIPTRIACAANWATLGCITRRAHAVHPYNHGTVTRDWY